MSASVNQAHLTELTPPVKRRAGGGGAEGLYLEGTIAQQSHKSVVGLIFRNEQKKKVQIFSFDSNNLRAEESPREIQQLVNHKLQFCGQSSFSASRTQHCGLSTSVKSELVVSARTP